MSIIQAFQTEIEWWFQQFWYLYRKFHSQTNKQTKQLGFNLRLEDSSSYHDKDYELNCSPTASKNEKKNVIPSFNIPFLLSTLILSNNNTQKFLLWEIENSAKWLLNLRDMYNKLQLLDQKFVTVTHHSCFSHVIMKYSRTYPQAALWKGKKNIEMFSLSFSRKNMLFFSHAWIKLLIAS